MLVRLDIAGVYLISVDHAQPQDRQYHSSEPSERPFGDAGGLVWRRLFLGCTGRGAIECVTKWQTPDFTVTVARVQHSAWRTRPLLSTAANKPLTPVYSFTTGSLSLRPT